MLFDGYVRKNGNKQGYKKESIILLITYDFTQELKVLLKKAMVELPPKSLLLPTLKLSCQ